MKVSNETRANNLLRQERIRRNWRQHDIAEHLGTTVVTVNRWERGSQQPSAYFRVKLCALFGKNPEELGLLPEVAPPQAPVETGSHTSSESVSPALDATDFPREALAAPSSALPHTDLRSNVESDAAREASPGSQHKAVYQFVDLYQTSQSHQDRVHIQAQLLRREHDVLKHGFRLPLRRTLLFWLAVSGAVVGILLGYTVGVLSMMPTLSSSCPFFEPTHVAILSPPSGSSVSRSIIVAGTACHIPEGKQFWLFVDSQERYYPQTGPIAVSSDGKWSTRVLIGSTHPNDRGASFLLVPVLVDQEGNAAIERSLTQSNVHSRYLSPLPRGIQVVSEELVIRQ